MGLVTRKRGQMQGAAQGFTLIGLMVVVAVINIGLGVAATSWVIINKRAQETELIWRGQQYVRALECHRNQTGGLPDELEELVESDCIRALYPEPMSRDGDWRIIRESDLRSEGGAGGGPAAADQGGLGSRASAEANVGGGGFRLGLGQEGVDRMRLQMEATRDLSDRVSAGLQGLDVRSRQGSGDGLGSGQQGVDRMRLQMEATRDLSDRLSARLQDLTDRLRQGSGGGSGNGIVGVASSSTQVSLRIYDGKSTYDAWQFVAR